MGSKMTPIMGSKMTPLWGHMDLDQFTKTLTSMIAAFAKKLRPGAVIAMLMSPTQYPAPEHTYTDHIADMLRAVKLPVTMRISVPYSTEQYYPLHVEWAKANRQCLVLTREIVVWSVTA